MISIQKVSQYFHKKRAREKIFLRRVRVSIVHYEGCLPELVITPMKYLWADCPGPVFSME